MIYLVTCDYCGFRSEKVIYLKSSAKLKCDRCGDKNLSVKEVGTDRIDTYVGCPPFPEKETNDELPIKELHDAYWDGFSD